MGLDSRWFVREYSQPLALRAVRIRSLVMGSRIVVFNLSLAVARWNPSVCDSPEQSRKVPIDEGPDAMRRSGRLTAQVGITAVLATVLAFVVPVFVDRHEYAKAVMDNIKNPNSENDATLRIERAKTQRIALEIHVVAAGVLFVLMNAGLLLVKRWSDMGPKS
jgi:hypothetical protein